jgi:hypothetical protein
VHYDQPVTEQNCPNRHNNGEHIRAKGNCPECDAYQAQLIALLQAEQRRRSDCAEGRHEWVALLDGQLGCLACRKTFPDFLTEAVDTVEASDRTEAEPNDGHGSEAESSLGQAEDFRRPSGAATEYDYDTWDEATNDSGRKCKGAWVFPAE